MRRITLLIINLLFVFFWSCLSDQQKTIKQTEAYWEVHESCLTVDSHVDTPFWLFREGFKLAGNPDSLNFRNQVDLEKMRQGGLDAVFFAVFVGQGEMTREGNDQAIGRARKEFDAIHEALAGCKDLARLGLSPDDAYNNEESGKHTIYIGIENGYAIGDSIQLLNEYYLKGARYVTLCHTRNNAICDSSTDPDGPLHDGLSEFGLDVVREMNRLGMIVDVSHISDKSFFDVLETSTMPVIASHSDTRALCDNPRNLTDSMIIALAEQGGVLQMCLLSDYVKDLPPNEERDSAFRALRGMYPNYSELSDEKKREAQQKWMDINARYPANLATVSDLVDHIDHVVSLVGIDHVGIGSDFDGGGRLSDCQDASQMMNITKELVFRGYTEEDIRKIWGGNLMRVFREVTEYAIEQNKVSLGKASDHEAIS
jgi:membrane dipeptidase